MGFVPNPLSRVPPLYAILDHDTAARAGWTLVDLASAFLDGGARLLQIRAKSLASGMLLEVAGAIVERSKASGAIVIVNDRADIARLVQADGVHVGQEDLAPGLVRAIVGPDAIVGFSTHTPAQIGAAVTEPITYLAIGPVFGTRTKATGYEAVGIERVRQVAALARPHGLPVVAIGGVTLDTAPEIIRAGAASVAVIGDLLTGGDPTARVRAFVERLAAIAG